MKQLTIKQFHAKMKSEDNSQLFEVLRAVAKQKEHPKIDWGPLGAWAGWSL